MDTQPSPSPSPPPTQQEQPKDAIDEPPSNSTVTTTKPAKATKKMKPARPQVKPGEIERKETPQTGKEYNIWYNKWAGGDREDPYSNKVKSQTRCHLKRDSGLTRANTTGMKYTCLFFARGCCPYGWECEYLHMLPDPAEQLPDSAKDCFARSKFADYRDDMGGVGSFNRQNRTLYIGRIKETGTGQETEDIVRRHFKEWGTIVNLRVLQYRGVAFVTYEHEVHAQFAKEAMACQSMDNEEILNVRWATEDPNPTTKVSEKRRLEEMGQEAIKARMDDNIVNAMRSIRALEDGVEPPSMDDSIHLDNDDQDYEPASKRLRLEPPKQDSPPQAKGLLSADTLQGLKYFAEIRQRHGGNQPLSLPTNPPRKPSGLGGIGDYGSDEDE